MSALNLNAAASLQEQKNKQAEARRSTRLAGKAHEQEPMAAPQPTRTSAASHASGMWNPDMGIRFGGVSPQANDSVKSNGTNPDNTSIEAKRWDPSKGLKFS